MPLMIAVCFVGIPAQAQYGGGNDTIDLAETSTYVFLSGQSTVVQTGGIAGVHWTYSVEGLFQLTVDPNAGTASFAHVDANATDDSPLRRTLDPNEVFGMTSLVGEFLDDRTISFTGKADDGSDVHITVNIEDDLAYLVGETIPPPNSADFFLFSLDGVAQRKYSGGSGEPNDPYRIATAEDLMLLGDSPDDYDKHFILTADIDLDPNLPDCKVFDRAVIAPDLDPNDAYSMFQGTSFMGVFNGDGHKILHLTIEGESYLGLFGKLDSEARIFQMFLEAVDIKGAERIIGSLVGNSHGILSQCYSTGVVSGDIAVGGLVGGNDGSIAKSYSTGIFTGDDKVGGLVGDNGYGGSITESYSTGMVNGNWYVGGLVGSNRDTITHCYSLADVEGEDCIGGLVGINGMLGPIQPHYFYGIISNSYSAGLVVGTHSAGGLVSYNAVGEITNSFWDIQTSDQSTSAGGTGLTTVEMQTASTFLEAGWDFIDESVNGTEDIWSICEETNYPRLVWQIPAGDFVCPDGITIEDFVFFIEHWRDDNCDLSNDYCQGTDLDFSGTVDEADLEILIENWLAGGN